MGTKNNPGKYDCYGKAEPDEPIFTLRSKDVAAEYLVAAWAALWAGDVEGAKRIISYASDAVRGSGKMILPYDSEKSIEAQQCAKQMRSWRVGKQIDRIESEMKQG